MGELRLERICLKSGEIIMECESRAQPANTNKCYRLLYWFLGPVILETKNYGRNLSNPGRGKRYFPSARHLYWLLRPASLLLKGFVGFLPGVKAAGV
jgi:hypothetical protein